MTEICDRGVVAEAYDRGVVAEELELELTCVSRICCWINVFSNSFWRVGNPMRASLYGSKLSVNPV